MQDIGLGVSEAINITYLAAMTAPVSHINKTCPRSHFYNGDGLRVSQVTGWFRSDYVWDVASSLPNVLQESNREDLNHPSTNPDPNDNAVYETRSEYTYVYGLDLISVTEEFPDKTTPPPAVQRYYFPDALGSTRALVNETDSGIETYGYDVFGQAREVDPAGAPLRSFMFTGEQYEGKARKQGFTGPFANPGFYYLRARFYDPTIGRFVTADPLPGSALDPQALSRYTYVRSNPTNFTDPTGHFLCWDGCSPGGDPKPPAPPPAPPPYVDPSIPNPPDGGEPIRYCELGMWFNERGGIVKRPDRKAEIVLTPHVKCQQSFNAFNIVVAGWLWRLLKTDPPDIALQFELEAFNIAHCAAKLSCRTEIRAEIPRSHSYEIVACSFAQGIVISNIKTVQGCIGAYFDVDSEARIKWGPTYGY